MMAEHPQTARSRSGGLLSIVIPMFNEANGLSALRTRMIPVFESLSHEFEIICINDGSTDDTWRALQELRKQGSRFKIINLSRNFSKERALAVGLEHATGDAVIPMDADLQGPPEVVPRLVEKWHEGYDSATGVRSDRTRDSFFKRVTAACSIVYSGE